MGRYGEAAIIKHFKTAQEACDYSVQKLVEQGKRCMNDGTCAYGDGQGNHCAIGWLLDPDNKALMNYDESVQEVVDEFQDDVPQIIKDHVCLFGDLQKFHDYAGRIWREEWRDRLRDNYKIDTSAPHWQKWVDMGANQ